MLTSFHQDNFKSLHLSSLLAPTQSFDYIVSFPFSFKNLFILEREWEQRRVGMWRQRRGASRLWPSVEPDMGLDPMIPWSQDHDANWNQECDAQLTRRATQVPHRFLFENSSLAPFCSGHVLSADLCAWMLETCGEQNRQLCSARTYIILAGTGRQTVDKYTWHNTRKW